MIRKSQLFLAVAALVGMNAAMAACNTTQWGQGGVTAVVGAPIADGPVNSDANPAITARYSGKCALRSNAPANYVQDGLPLAEAAYISRFYVLAANTGEATIFNAMADETTDYPVFKITYDAPAAAFKFYGFDSNPAAPVFGTPASIPAVANRWYVIETSYARGAGTTNGTLSIKVNGNRPSSQVLAGAPQVATLSNMKLMDAGDGVDFVQLGWVAGGAGTSVIVDAFESRRSTAIGELRRGDASGNGLCSSGDITQILLDVNAITLHNEPGLKAGQTDCNENGTTSAGDATCISLIVNSDTLAGGNTIQNCGAPATP